MVDAVDVGTAVAREAIDIWLFKVKFRTWLIVVLLLAVGGWYFASSAWDFSDENSSSSIETSTDTGWRTYSVVAPVDTGINVYHERFILNETLPDWLLDGL